MRLYIKYIKRTLKSGSKTISVKPIEKLFDFYVMHLENVDASSRRIEKFLQRTLNSQ